MIQKQCIVCGSFFFAKDGRNKFCSDECKAIRYRQKKQEWMDRRAEGKRQVKTCVICGRPFKPKQSSIQITCSEECSRINRLNHQQERDKRNHISTMADYKARLEKQKEETRLRKEKEKQERSNNRKYYKGICKVCGKEFTTLNPKQVTCSTQCGKRWNYRRKEKRLKGKIVDNNITLEALYNRDLGVCYLCGCKCDWQDKTITPEGYTITGSSYPTIEHIIPLSRGGLHEWKNIRLACFKCNLAKSDSMLENLSEYIEDIDIPSLPRKIREKKVSQYDKSHNLIATFRSTREAERITGVKAKGIQNNARGETKSYRGYLWKYEI